MEESASTLDQTISQIQNQLQEIQHSVSQVKHESQNSSDQLQHARSLLTGLSSQVETTLSTLETALGSVCDSPQHPMKQHHQNFEKISKINPSKVEYPILKGRKKDHLSIVQLEFESSINQPPPKKKHPPVYRSRYLLRSQSGEMDYKYGRPEDIEIEMLKGKLHTLSINQSRNQLKKINHSSQSCEPNNSPSKRLKNKYIIIKPESKAGMIGGLRKGQPTKYKRKLLDRLPPILPELENDTRPPISVLPEVLSEENQTKKIEIKDSELNVHYKMISDSDSTETDVSSVNLTLETNGTKIEEIKESIFIDEKKDEIENEEPTKEEETTQEEPTKEEDNDQVETTNEEEKVEVDNNEEKVDVDNNEEKAEVDNSEEKVEVDNSEEKVEVDNSEEKIEADNSEEKAEVDNSEEKIEADNSEEKVEVDNNEEKVEVDNNEEKVDVDNNEEKIEVDNSEEKIESTFEDEKMESDKDEVIKEENKVEEETIQIQENDSVPLQLTSVLDSVSGVVVASVEDEEIKEEKEEQTIEEVQKDPDLEESKEIVEENNETTQESEEKNENEVINEEKVDISEVDQTIEKEEIVNSIVSSDNVSIQEEEN